MSVISELRMKPATTRYAWDAPRYARLLVTGTAMFFLLVGANLATPLYPAIQAELAFGPFGTTIAFTAYVVALIVMLILAGHWSDHIGRRAALVLAVLLGLAGSLVFGFSVNLLELCVGRGLQGIAVGLATGASAAALRELLPKHPEWASRFTLLTSSGGVAAGPVLGGLLSQLPGGRVTPFVLQSVALILVLIPLIWVRARPAIMHAGHGYGRTALAPRKLGVPFEARAQFWLASGVGFLSFAIFGFYLSLAPSHFAHQLGIHSPVLVGVLAGLTLGIAALSQMLPVRGAWVVPVGLLLMAAGAVILALASSLASLPLLVLASVTIGSGQGMAFRTVFNEAASAVPLILQAQVISTVYVLTYLGSAVPVLALGWATGVFGLQASVNVYAAAIAVSGVLLSTTAVRAHRRRARLS